MRRRESMKKEEGRYRDMREREYEERGGEIHGYESGRSSEQE